jgi:hypothetical protein
MNFRYMLTQNLIPSVVSDNEKLPQLIGRCLDQFVYQKPN